VKFAGILNAYKRQPPKGHDRKKPPIGGDLKVITNQSPSKAQLGL